LFPEDEAVLPGTMASRYRRVERQAGRTPRAKHAFGLDPRMATASRRASAIEKSGSP